MQTYSSYFDRVIYDLHILSACANLSIRFCDFTAGVGFWVVMLVYLFIRFVDFKRALSKKIGNFADCTWRVDENLMKTATALALSSTRRDEKAALRRHIL
ncbi:hypothetical protein RvY_00862 [Ramazzottius varieornatus]|uniref:Uncharacterized protein n=1 Tax=Ramazzottius varieornatus TaxID=947166 RepID=A0A1D1UEP1_RAMVA|nr:hypothetical protein RvY_00862 [Ramazzottius varieornatus]